MVKDTAAGSGETGLTSCYFPLIPNDSKMDMELT